MPPNATPGHTSNVNAGNAVAPSPMRVLAVVTGWNPTCAALAPESAMNKKTFNDPAYTYLFADVLPNGSGGFIIAPRKPTREITSTQAAKMLNLSRSTLGNIVNFSKAHRLLRWRWTSEKMGKRIFELESVLRYREATRDSEFGRRRSSRRRRLRPVKRRGRR
jgi:hypothetical protein